MIRLMIVDDEPIARQGIREAIDWGELGVKVVGEAENGDRALEELGRLRPDLILCDVRMPVMDGIGLIRELRRSMPSIRVIMLSAYADSEYMREAIRSGVCDYLVKPAGKDQIREAVLRACGAIAASREKERRDSAQRSLIDENIDALRERFFESLLMGSDGEGRLLDRARLLDLPLDGRWHAFVLAGFKGKEPEPLVREFERVFASMSAVGSRIPRTKGVCALLSLDRRDPEDIAAAARAGRVAESPFLATPLVLSPICGPVVALREHFRKSISLLHRSMWYAEGGLILIESEELQPFPRAEAESIELRLLDSIREGDTEAALRGFDDLMKLFGTTRPEAAQAYPIISRVFEAMRMLTGLDLDPNRELEGTPEGLREHFARLCRASKPMQGRFGGGSLGRALRYMARRYADNISLESMAAELCVSPTHLSRMLNEKTDKGFQGWLCFFRVEKAKELLALTDMKNYDIATAVGFGSYKVFSEHFHELVGMTAKKYRAIHSSGAGIASETDLASDQDLPLNEAAPS